jgi:hypothetical protein
MSPHTPSDYRQAYGSVFIVETLDGVIPWIPLSLGDYFSYVRAIDKGNIAVGVIENEIFIKCVLDEVLVENIDKHKAGLVSSVVDTILRASAPQTTEEFEFLLDVGRGNINNILHQAINTIIQAFPGYTPDDLYALDVYVLMDRLALAERKLLENGFLKEPISLIDDKKKKKRKPKVDLTKLKQEFEREQEPLEEFNICERRKAGDTSGYNKTVVEDETNLEPNSLTDEEGNTMISLDQLTYGLDADPTSGSPEEKQMLQDARKIYGDYLEKMKKGQKVKIKPQDERVRDTEKMIEERRQKLQEQIKKSKKRG